MGKDGKHIHFEWPDEDMNIFDEVDNYAVNYSKNTTKDQMIYARGLIMGCNDQRNALFRSFVKETFKAGVKYGLDNKIKITEHLDSECDKNNEEGAKGLYL